MPVSVEVKYEYFFTWGGRIKIIEMVRNMDNFSNLRKSILTTDWFHDDCNEFVISNDPHVTHSLITHFRNEMHIL